MKEPTWISEARKYIGQKEIKGITHNPFILSLWKAIKRGGIKTDEVPWCAAFVGAMLEATGYVSSRFESATSYLTWGIELKTPALGCIVIFQREGGGHVGFVVGLTPSGNLLVLGGNQNDQVQISAFKKDRVVGYRWPQAAPHYANYAMLPVLVESDLSTKES